MRRIPCSNIRSFIEYAMLDLVVSRVGFKLIDDDLIFPEYEHFR